MRQIKLAEGVFNKIVGTNRDVSSYDHFINIEKTVGSSPNIASHMKEYKAMVKRYRPKFEKLASLEEIIILYRIRENRDIQLSTQREYIYARQACPRSDIRNQDIRLCVANTEFYDMSTYETNPDLIQKADKKVCDVLDELIREKEKQFLIYPN